MSIRPRDELGPGERGRASWTLAGLLAAVAAALAVAASAAAAVHRESVGVMFNCLEASPSDQAAVYDALSAARVGWVRINVAWYDVEPEPGRYAPDALARLGRCSALARSHGAKVLVVLLGTPAWARQGDGWADPPRDPETYADALGHLAARYPGVSAWEVWNEENTRTFWHGTAGEYVRLLQASYRAVKAANPRALVVFGGTAHSDAAWIRSAYREGARGYFDVLAIHPYPHVRTSVGLGRVLGPVRRVRRVMLDNHDARTRIWLTEFGWSAAYVGAEGQARMLTRSLAYTRRHLRYVTAAFWFEAKNECASVPADSWQGGLSLITPDLGLTPAYRALQRWTGAS